METPNNSAQHQHQIITASTQSATLPAGVSLANLQLGGQNLRLHNLVQLANVQGMTQSIAVPISLTMMPNNNNAGTISTQALVAPQGSMIMSLDGAKMADGQQFMLVDASGNSIGDASQANNAFGGATVLMQAAPGTMTNAGNNVVQLPIGMHNIAQLLGGTFKSVQQGGQNIQILQMNPGGLGQPQQMQVIRQIPATATVSAAHNIAPQLATVESVQGQQIGLQIQQGKTIAVTTNNHHHQMTGNQQPQQLQYVIQQKAPQTIQLTTTSAPVSQTVAAKRAKLTGKGKGKNNN